MQEQNSELPWRKVEAILFYLPGAGLLWCVLSFPIVLIILGQGVVRTGPEALTLAAAVIFSALQYLAGGYEVVARWDDLVSPQSRLRLIWHMVFALLATVVLAPPALGLIGLWCDMGGPWNYSD